MEFLIADDHPIFRNGLKSLLESDFPLVHIVEFSNGKEALDYILSNNPDIAILDVDMPLLSGLDVVESTYSKTSTKFIILSMHADPEIVLEAKNKGALAYVVKENTGEELTDCINAVLTSSTFVSKIANDDRVLSTLEKEQRKIIDRLKALTQTELKTLKLVSQKYTSKEIADLLFVSTKSVDNYRSRICKKLLLDSKNNSLLSWAIEHKSMIHSFTKD